jgi:type II secretory pathway pseudopilin PulG
VILVGLGSFRARARDARRVSDLSTIQSSLELYYTKFSQYPQDLAWDALQSEIVNANVGVTKIAKDPSTGRAGYDQYAFDSSSDRQEYVLRAQLEDANNAVLSDSFHGFTGYPTPGITIDCSNTPSKPYYCVKF